MRESELRFITLPPKLTLNRKRYCMIKVHKSLEYFSVSYYSRIVYACNNRKKRKKSFARWGVVCPGETRNITYSKVAKVFEKFWNFVIRPPYAFPSCNIIQWPFTLWRRMQYAYRIKYCLPYVVILHSHFHNPKLPCTLDNANLFYMIP